MPDHPPLRGSTARGEPMARRRLPWVALCAALVAGIPLAVALAKPAATGGWVGSWAASQQIPEPRNALPAQELRDATLRQIVHLSTGGRELRVRLSNAFGTAPLQIESVHIARPVSLAEGSIDPTTDTELSFDGRPEVTIPAGAEYLSDPVA